MRMGMLHLFENPVGKTEHQIIKEQMELMYEAENLGFDSVWPAEHHFSEYGYCASPQVSLAAVAARTKRIRLGTGVVVLPFHNPIRVAEDFAFLDLMSDGRVDLGIGRGYQPIEYKGFGLADKQAVSRELFDEATTLRYLSSLGSHDLVQRDDETGRYSLGLKLFQLGQQAVGLRDVRKLALPHMERLLEQFEETVNIAHRRGHRLVVIDVLESPRSIRRGASVGEPDVWHASALGKSILASLPLVEARRLLESADRQPFTPHTLVDVDELIANLDGVRSRGYAIDDEEYEAGLRCVAAPICDSRGRPTFALSISGVAARMAPQVTEQMGQAVLQAARSISVSLGYMAQNEEEGTTHGSS